MVELGVFVQFTLNQYKHASLVRFRGVDLHDRGLYFVVEIRHFFAVRPICVRVWRLRFVRESQKGKDKMTDIVSRKGVKTRREDEG